MPEDAPPNGDAPQRRSIRPSVRVSEMQAKLHCWATADPGRRFDDLFNFVYDPATLIVAFARVAGNQGARSPGVDGLTVADIGEQGVFPGSWTTYEPSCGTVRFGHFRCGNARSPNRVGRARSVDSGYLRLRTGSCRRR